jgi:predicted transport protein
MKYTNVALKDKITEMYPDIEKQAVKLNITFNEEKNAFILRFKRGKDELVTHLDRSDADDCMNNIRCVHLGIKVDQFVRNFEARATFGKKVA